MAVMNDLDISILIRQHLTECTVSVIYITNDRMIGDGMPLIQKHCCYELQEKW
jgi:CRISPR/Cas system type I-B associated protein Csh2 (Cas7 group RAMP superfamily)